MLVCALVWFFTHLCQPPHSRQNGKVQDPASRLQEVEEEIERVRALQFEVPKAVAPPAEDEVSSHAPPLPLAPCISARRTDVPFI